jgi:2-oxo-4-hydroxy-4-carboxy-5-ureidoimidazoline decarboxylase
VRLEEVNALGESEFVARLGGVFEHSPWVAQRAWSARPFASLDALHKSMVQAVTTAGRDEQLALLRAQPEIAGREASEGTLSADSGNEQARLGFTRLARDKFAKMTELNRSYREKFGFPCIVALRLHESRDSVMFEMARRLAGDAEGELKIALEQIGHIARGRLEKIIDRKWAG